MQLAERDVLNLYTAGRSHFQYNVSISTSTSAESEYLRCESSSNPVAVSI